MSLLQQRLEELATLVAGSDMSLATRRLMDLCDEHDGLRDLSNEAMQLRADYNMQRELGAPELLGTHGEAFASRARALVQRAVERASPLVAAESPAPRTEVFRALGMVKRFRSGGHHFTLGPLDLSMHTGEITGLVGENGNGKTTLLRQIAGQLDHNEGRKEYPQAGDDPYRIRGSIAWIPQRSTRWYGTLLQNLRFTAAVHGLKGQRNEERVMHTLHRLGLTRFKDLTWSQLSSGYKLRFELAKMVVWRPRVLVLDEPIANLDLQAQQLFLQDLKHLAASQRHPVSVILSSQQLHEIEAIADNIIFLKNGKAVYSGSASSFDHDRLSNVYEIKGDLDRGRLMQALAHLQPIQVDDTGLVWRITTSREVTSRDVLLAVSQGGMQVSYFRDISTSTRKLFHQDT